MNSNNNKTIFHKIFKYPLEDQITITTIPSPAIFVSLGLDANGVSCVWFIVDENSNEYYNFYFHKYGTGWIIDRDFYTKANFLGTVVEGPYVWHVFSSRSELRRVDCVDKSEKNIIYIDDKTVREQEVNRQRRSFIENVVRKERNNS